MKKITSELSLDELLKQLEKTQDQKPENPTEYRNDILGFFNFFQIQNGENYIAKRALRKVYTQWSKEPVKAKAFYYELNSFLKQSECGRGYHINQNVINLSSSAYRYYTDKRKHNKIKNPNWKKHFDSFLRFYSIKNGTAWVPWFALYFIYDKWNYENKSKNPLVEVNFIAFCRVYFKLKRKNDYYWFAVDESIYKNISIETITTLIVRREERVKEKGKRIFPQGKRSISRIEARIKSKNKI